MNRKADAPDVRAVEAATTGERLALCSILERLKPEEWDVPSLCDGWAVRDVVGHLTLATHETVRDMVVGMIKARGSFDRMTRDTAINRAKQFEPAELIEQIRATAESTRRAPMSSPHDPLLDIMVHTQDITRPLERSYVPNPERVDLALDHAVTSRWYGGAKRFAMVTLEATDTTWTAGSGDQPVAGPAVDLLLMATGRVAGFDGLSGPGVATLRRQLFTS